MQKKPRLTIPSARCDKGIQCLDAELTDIEEYTSTNREG